MNLKRPHAGVFRICCADGLRLAALLALLALTGCGAPAPLMPDQRSTSFSEPRPRPAPEAYKIRSGDTLYSIAFGFGLDWRSVARWNAISAPYTIHVGDWIRLQPPPDMRPAVVATETPETRSAPAVGRDNRADRETSPGAPASRRTTEPTTPGPGPSESVSTPSAQPEPKPPPPAPPRRPPAESGADPAPVPAAATRSVAGVIWRWPTSGNIARGFNSGASRKGILIAGEDGQPIRAAADGEVVYSGNGLIGYGELIIIKHSDRMLSAYAHNRERLVGEGQRVRSGEQIARMGSNERDQTVLHFEIRRDGKPDNPVSYLPTR